MSEFQPNIDKSSQLGEAMPFTIQGTESFRRSTAAGDIDGLLGQLKSDDLSKDEVTSIVRQLGYISSEHQDLDFATRIEQCERISWSLLNSPHECWREAVRYLDDACSLRLECARTGEYYDSRILPHRMLIVGCYRQFSDCREDYEAYGKHVDKAFEQLLPYVASESHSSASRERALSMAHILVKAMPICFWASDQKILGAITQMVTLAGATYAPGGSVRELPSWGETISPACAGYIWGALSTYYSTAASIKSSDAHLESAHRTAAKHFEELFKAATSIPENEDPVILDAVGREVPKRLYLAQQVVMARVTLAEREVERGNVAAFTLSWHYAIENSPIVDNEQFDELLTKFSDGAQALAKGGDLLHSSQIELALARACRNRCHPEHGKAFEHYADAVSYITGTEQIEYLSRILDEGVSCYRRSVKLLDSEGFLSAGRFMLRAYDLFSQIQRDFERSQISDSLIDPFTPDDFSAGRLILHPLAADASPILTELINACDVRDSSLSVLYLRISAHLCFAEYAVEKGWEHLSAIHIDETYELLGGTCGDYPKISPYQLVKTQLRLGKLMRERGDEMEFHAYCLFDDALKEISGSNLKLAEEDVADLYYSVGLYHAAHFRYGEAINRFRVAYEVLDPESKPDQRVLALTILRAWADTEISEGDPVRGQELLSEFQSSMYEWHLDEFF